MLSLHASCMFSEGVSGLSCQRSLMPLDPGRRLDGIIGNWIVFHLLWKQPGRDTRSPLLQSPQYLQSLPWYTQHPPPPLTGAPLFPSHYGGMSYQTLCFYMSTKVSPCGAETLGWMSAECSIKQLLAQYQQHRSCTV